MGPLPLGSLYHLIRDHLGLSLARPMLLRLEELSGGNPFFALELARAWQARGERIRSLPPAVREVLAVAAASGQPTVHALIGLVGP
ncbi:MAG TPA: hypothetical protein VGB19_06995 [Actinomycetota bacterium]